MKIQPISNNTNYASYNRKKINFRGEFRANEALDYVMIWSSAGDLKNFKDLLQRIKKVQDNLIFWVESFSGRSEIYGGGGTDYYLYKQNGEDKKTEETLVGMREDVSPSLRLAKINCEIENLYKNVISIEDKNGLMNEIKELLTE